MIALRPLDTADLPALHALLAAEVDGPTAWTEAELRQQLYDAARDHGRRVAVAARGGEVLGCAGWVEAPPWCFGAPVIAVDAAAAAALVAHVVARGDAIGAERIRISAGPRQAGKRRALVAAGFAPVFEFVWFGRPVAPGDGAPWVDGDLRRVGWAELDVAALADVHNDTFDGVPNSTPLSPQAMREVLDEPAVDRGATAAWATADGRYAAFVQVDRPPAAAPVGVVGAIGVRAAHRGRGLAGALLDDAIARLAADGVGEVRALIASTNAASLALHAGRGFTELERFAVFERRRP